MRTSAPATAVLLDTCAIIWIGNDEPLSRAATEAVLDAGRSEGVLISPVSAWEIGLASRPRGGRGPSFQFRPDPKAWFARVMRAPGVKPAIFTPDIAIGASHLPGDFHADPGDRLLIATARHLAVPIVTRDRKIIDYAGAGYVEVIPC